MKLFDYSELIRVIDNVEIREQKEKDMTLNNLKKEYQKLKTDIINCGILDDWYRLKELCFKARIRLSVSHQGSNSIGCMINHKDTYRYCSEYSDNGNFLICMSSGSSWSDYFGFRYSSDEGISWITTHTSSFHIFECFKTEEDEYNTKIKMLKTFINTYEDYRDFQLKRIKYKFDNRIKSEDIIEER